MKTCRLKMRQQQVDAGGRECGSKQATLAAPVISVCENEPRS